MPSRRSAGPLPFPVPPCLYRGRVTSLSSQPGTVLCPRCPLSPRQAGPVCHRASGYAMVVCCQARPGLRRVVTKLPWSQCMKATCSARAHGTCFHRVRFGMRSSVTFLGSCSAGHIVQVQCFPTQVSNSEFCIEESQYLCCYSLIMAGFQQVS